MMQSQLQLLQRRCAELNKENESVRLSELNKFFRANRNINCSFVSRREQLASAERLIQRKDEAIALIRLLGVEHGNELHFLFEF